MKKIIIATIVVLIFGGTFLANKSTENESVGNVGSTPGGLTVPQGGTGYTMIDQYAWLSGNGSGALRLNASTSPTVGSITATSSGLTSNFTNINITGTCTGCGGAGVPSKFATSTIDALAIYPAGATRVGIGTSSPSSILTASATSSLSNLNLFDVMVVPSAGATTTGLTINNLGNVGLGTSTPTGRFTITGTNNTFPLSRAVSAAIFIDGVGTSPHIIWDDGSSGAASIAGESGTLRFYTVPTTGASIATNERLRITNAGNVGIGTTTPDVILDIVGDFKQEVPSVNSYALFDVGAGNTNQARMWLKLKTFNSTSEIGLAAFNQSGAVGLGNNISSDVTMAGSAFVIGQDGNGATPFVGISTTSPSATLSINQRTATSLGMYIAGFANSSRDLMRVSTSTLTATTTSFVVSSNGYIGIGTSTPGAMLAVQGRVIMDGLTVSGTTQPTVLCQTAGGEIIAENTTCALSTEKVKHNIENLEVSGLDAVMKMKPITFEYNKTGNRLLDSRGLEVGFKAEDILKIDKALVDFTLDGEVRNIRTDGILAYTVKAVQELNKKVDNLTIGKITRSVEENWQWLAIILLFLGLVSQQVQISKLKK